jgi:hypothetical protein
MTRQLPDAAFLHHLETVGQAGIFANGPAPQPVVTHNDGWRGLTPGPAD